MIENIRKYKALIIFALALVIIALVVGIKDDLFRRGSGGGSVMRIDGRSYSDREFHQFGTGGLELASGLVQTGGYGFDMELFQFVTTLTADAAGREEMPEKFFVGRMILRNAAQDFGLYPSEDQISDFIRKMRAFGDKDGKFDESIYRRFVEKGLGRLGLTEGDVRDLASDVLVLGKLNDVVGKGLAVDRSVAARKLALDNQRVSGSLARIDIDAYEAKIQPTDAELKTYWETIQDSFKTEVRRNFTYLLATPEAVPEPADDANKPESIVDATLSDEAKKAADQKKADEKAKKTAELAEIRRKKQLELDSKVDEFAFQIEQQKGSNFDELAKQNGWEVKTTGMFAIGSAPKEIDIALRASSRKGKAVDELFVMKPTSDPISKISQPIPVGENQWLIARYEGEEPARAKTFEEAKEDARSQYIAEKAAEALKKAGNEAIEKIRAALAAGKSFADAAKDAGIPEVKTFEKVTSTSTPDAATEPRNLFNSASTIDPGAVADLVIESDRVFVIHVASRELVKEAGQDARVDGEIKSQESSNQSAAFRSWLAAQIEAAKVEALYRK